MTANSIPTPVQTETSLSPLTAAIAASPEFAARVHDLPAGATPGSHPLLNALIAFMASPAGQQLEAALVAMILSLLAPKNP